MTEHSKRASELLLKLKEHEEEKISIQQILEGFEAAGFSMLIIIFAIPVALPVPAVGYGTVMAIPMLLLCIQLLLGFSHPKLPHFLGKRQLTMDFFCKVVDKAVPFLRKIELLLKPRFFVCNQSSRGEIDWTVLCDMCAFCDAAHTAHQYCTEYGDCANGNWTTGA